jgi:uncharacterized protein YdaU (DUF1376 family)
MYARAWLSSTLGMAHDVKGAYIDLLCWQWDNGPIPNSPAWRARIFSANPKETARLWARLRSKFVRTPRGWINLRMEAQRQELAAHRAQAITAAKARWQGPKSKRASLEHAPEHAASTCSTDAQGMLPSMGAASNGHMLNGCTPTPTPSPKRKNNRRTAPVQPPPFKVYAAIAARAFAEEPTDDLGAVAERMKRLCAEQGKPYHADIVGRAMRAAEIARLRRTTH